MFSSFPSFIYESQTLTFSSLSFSFSIYSLDFFFEVKTSSLSLSTIGAVWSSHVLFRLFGDQKVSPPFTLLEGRVTQGSTLTFLKTLEEVGELRCLEIKSFSPDAWLFDSIHVSGPGSSKIFKNSFYWLDYHDATMKKEIRLCGWFSFYRHSLSPPFPPLLSLLFFTCKKMIEK